MSKAEFDQFAKSYDKVLGDSIPSSVNDDAYFAEYKVALLSKQLTDLTPKRILDFGCGAGRSLPYLVKYFPSSEVWGFDVSTESLSFAKQRAPSAEFFHDWKDVKGLQFDVIFAANVFHHIPTEERVQALKVCRAKLTEGGSFHLFEHNLYNPATRWVFERCPLDVNAEMLSLRTAMRLGDEAGYSVNGYQYTLFFPKQLAFLRGIEPLLSRIPLGAQYYLRLDK